MVLQAIPTQCRCEQQSRTLEDGDFSTVSPEIVKGEQFARRNRGRLRTRFVRERIRFLLEKN
jgi:hypothetical protein